MSKEVAQDELAYMHLLHMMLRAKRHIAAAAVGQGMTPIQATLLALLDQDDERSMNELAELMGCDASNITGIVERLEAQDFIERRSCDDDRRIKMIRLSQKGCVCKTTVLRELRASEALDLSVLDEQEAAELKRLLAKLTEE